VPGAGPDDLARLRDRIVEVVAAPFGLAAGTVSVGVSVGLAVAGEGETVDDLVRRADDAMYAAKAAGRRGPAH
jgi:GGDEF domain-containing protein